MKSLKLIQDVLDHHFNPIQSKEIWSEGESKNIKTLIDRVSMSYPTAEYSYFKNMDVTRSQTKQEIEYYKQGYPKWRLSVYKAISDKYMDNDFDYFPAMDPYLDEMCVQLIKEGVINEA